MDKEKVKNSAKTNFKSGLNCAESVLKAILDNVDHNFPDETVALATGFGGGMGLTGNNCGALLGGVMAVGLVHGRKNPLEGEFKERVDKLYGNPGLYRFFNSLPHRFTDQFGAIDCKKLNEDFDVWFDKDRFRRCMTIVIETAEMAMDLIVEGQETGYTQSFGKNMAGKE
jgi:C_GCAxxG_C_C family probable redox protein